MSMERIKRVKLCSTCNYYGCEGDEKLIRIFEKLDSAHLAIMGIEESTNKQTKHDTEDNS